MTIGRPTTQTTTVASSVVQIRENAAADGNRIVATGNAVRVGAILITNMKSREMMRKHHNKAEYMNRVEIGDCIIAGIAEGGTALEQMNEIVTRLESAGYVIVPLKSTPDMNWAGSACKNHHKFVKSRFHAGVPDIWDAMIKAELASKR